MHSWSRMKNEGSAGIPKHELFVILILIVNQNSKNCKRQVTYYLFINVLFGLKFKTVSARILNYFSNTTARILKFNVLLCLVKENHF